MHYRLQTNPFFVLGLPVSASQQDAVDAYEDRASDDPANEALFAEARQALLTPRMRLMAEIGFLPDTPDGEVRRLTHMMRTPGGDLAAARASAHRLSPLSRSNVLAWLSTQQRPDADLIVDLNGAQAEIDHQTLLFTFERARASAGIAPPTAEALREAVLQQFEEQNSVVVQAIEDPNLLAEAVSATTKRVLALGDAERLDRLDSFLQTYWRAVSRETSDIRGLLEQCGKDILKNPSDDESIETYIRGLKRWGGFGNPLQVFERTKGREDREAQSLQRMVRGLCLELANDKACSDVSYRISEAASNVFAELERASQELAEDLKQLKTNIALESCSELERQVTSARKTPHAFRAALKSLTASARPQGAPGQLLRELDELLSRHPAPFDHPLVLTRNLAVDLFNESKDTAATRILTTELLKAAREKKASEDVVKQLETDLRELDRIDLETELKQAVEANDLPTAEFLIAKLLPLMESSEARWALSDLGSRIRAKRASSRLKVVFGLSAAAIGLIVLVIANNDRPRYSGYSPPPPYTAPPSLQPTPLPQSSPTALPPPTLPSDFTESIPSKLTPEMGVNGPQRSIAEIRYCKFEEVRLEKIRSRISSISAGAIIDLFNVGINDLNARCSRYTSRRSDSQLVERQVIERNAALTREAEARLMEWGTKTSQPAPRPSAELDRQITLDLLIPDEARRVQVRLIELGFFKGPANGTWGPASRAAMRVFNIVSGLGDSDAAETSNLTRLFAVTASRASGTLPSLPRSYAEATFTAPSGAKLHPLNTPDATLIHRRLRELGFYRGRNDTLWSNASRVALREFKQRAGLPRDEIWDGATETALFSAPVDPKADADKDFDQNIAGRWSTEPQNCQRPRAGQALPLVITKTRASANNQGCEFLERQGSGSNWTIRASCRVDSQTWIANIRLSRSGDSLTWSSEKGVTVYRRCQT